MTVITTTMQPYRSLDVDAAELESLTRQGLVVGVPPPRHTTPTDPVVAYVSTTLAPGVVLGVGAAELESLSRQHLIGHVYVSPQVAVSDTLTVSDLVARKEVTCTTADTLGVADVATRSALGRSRTVADSVTVTDTASRAALARTRSVSDTVGLADTTTSSGGYGVGGYGVTGYGI